MSWQPRFPSDVPYIVTSLTRAKSLAAPKWPWRIVPYIQGLNGVMYVCPAGNIQFQHAGEAMGIIQNTDAGFGSLGGQLVTDPYTNGLAWRQNNVQFARVDDIHCFDLFNDVNITRAFVHRWVRSASAGSWDSSGSLVGIGHSGNSNPIQGCARSGTDDLRIYFDYSTEYVNWAGALTNERRGFHIMSSVNSYGASIIDTQDCTVQGASGEFLLNTQTVHPSAQRDISQRRYRITWGAGSFNTPSSNGDADHVDTHVFFDIDTDEFKQKQQQGYWWDPETRWDAYDEYGRTSYFIMDTPGKLVTPSISTSKTREKARRPPIWPFRLTNLPNVHCAMVGFTPFPTQLYPDGATNQAMAWGTAGLQGDVETTGVIASPIRQMDNTQRIVTPLPGLILNDNTQPFSVVHRITRSGQALTGVSTVWDNWGGFFAVAEVTGSTNRLSFQRQSNSDDLSVYPHNTNGVTWAEALASARNTFTAFSIISTGTNGQDIKGYENTSLDLNSTGASNRNQGSQALELWINSERDGLAYGDQDWVDTFVFENIDVSYLAEKGFFSNEETRWSMYDEYGRTSYFLSPIKRPSPGTTILGF